MVSSSLRKSMRKFRISYDSAFDDVVAGCADSRRPHGWINDDFIQAYRRLFGLGWAHSVEVWTQGDSPILAGGVFGIELGGLFAAESMFHSVTDASKAALVGLVEVLAKASQPSSRILDAQWLTPHLASLGGVEVSRTDYVRLLPEALSLEPAFPSRTT